MADISKIKLPNNNTYNLKDANAGYTMGLTGTAKHDLQLYNQAGTVKSNVNLPPAMPRQLVPEHHFMDELGNRFIVPQAKTLLSPYNISLEEGKPWGVEYFIKETADDNLVFYSTVTLNLLIDKPSIATNSEVIIRYNANNFNLFNGVISGVSYKILTGYNKETGAPFDNSIKLKSTNKSMPLFAIAMYRTTGSMMNADMLVTPISSSGNYGRFILKNLSNNTIDLSAATVFNLNVMLPGHFVDTFSESVDAITTYRSVSANELAYVQVVGGVGYEATRVSKNLALRLHGYGLNAVNISGWLYAYDSTTYSYQATSFNVTSNKVRVVNNDIFTDILITLEDYSSYSEVAFVGLIIKNSSNQVLYYVPYILPSGKFW